MHSRGSVWIKAGKPVDKGFFPWITVENPVENVDGGVKN